MRRASVTMKSSMVAHSPTLGASDANKQPTRQNVVPSAYREQIGLGPVLRTGKKACQYEDYVEYATKRIAILEAQVAKIQDKSCPTRKSLKKMALCYRNRLEKRRAKLDAQSAMRKVSQSIIAVLRVT